MYNFKTFLQHLVTKCAKRPSEVLIYFAFPLRNMIFIVVLYHEEHGISTCSPSLEEHDITTCSPSLEEHDIINSLSSLSSQKNRKIY